MQENNSMSDQGLMEECPDGRKARDQIQPQFIHSPEAGFWRSISMPNVSKRVANSTMLSHCSTFSACL
jgi:hypothetical protein